MTTITGNVTAAGTPVRDEDLVPVHCKCCGKLHPACGCWNPANKEQLVGHYCLDALNQCVHLVDVVWNSRHPSQQRSAIYFHQHRLEENTPDLIIYRAAAAELELRYSRRPLTPEEAAALAKAKTKIAQHEDAVKVSMAFLDEQDPTRSVH